MGYGYHEKNLLTSEKPGSLPPGPPERWWTHFGLLAWSCGGALSAMPGRLTVIFSLAASSRKVTGKRGKKNNALRPTPSPILCLFWHLPQETKTKKPLGKAWSFWRLFHRINALTQGAFLISIFPKTILPTLQCLDLIRRKWSKPWLLMTDKLTAIE